MKKYTIHKNCHYSNFFPAFKCVKSIDCIKKIFKFQDNCAYNITEKSCVNKLFGFCFGFGVHKNSVRFGWTYSKADELIHIWRYYYKDGKLNKKEIFTTNLSKSHEYCLLINKIANNEYQIVFMIDDEVKCDSIIFKSKCPFITTLGPYFGGNTRAPHKMEIKAL